MKEPMLVAGTDGVGTKLKISFDMKKYDTVGIDLVAMCVNDLIVTGAKPLFFLDYIATGKLSAEDMSDIVKGIADGCKESSVALIGGETAEMPGMYSEDEFDLAGFSVGIVDKANIIDGKNITEDNLVIGIESSGFHSNGYSLLRKICFEVLNLSSDKIIYDNTTLGEMLLEPTKIYVKPILELLSSDLTPLGMVHITGGGFYENIPRVLPDDIDVILDIEMFPNQNFVKFIKDTKQIVDKELYRVFNMGIGFILIVKKENANDIINKLKSQGEKAHIIGKTQKGAKEVKIKGVDF
jgi:phosphoribosylformylglycinamidine cyclo-ligase